MSEYAHSRRETTRSAVAHASVQRGARADAALPARGHAARHDALAEALNRSARVQFLAQMKQMLDASPRMQSQRALQRALNPGFGRAAIQLKKDDARKFINAHNLNAKIDPKNFDYWDVLNFAKDMSNAKDDREGLVAEWNRGQGSRYTITEDILGEPRPQRTDLMMELLKLLTIGPQPQFDWPPHHFTAAATVETAYDPQGALLDPEERTKKASKPKRTKAYKSLGLGEHVIKGHFMDDQTLYSQARSDKYNFTWSSDEALLAAIERGREEFAEVEGSISKNERKGQTVKAVEVLIGANDGHAIVQADDGEFYIVHPKRARVIRKEQGDFKSAYGIAETKKLREFSGAYYSWLPYKT